MCLQACLLGDSRSCHHTVIQHSQLPTLPRLLFTFGCYHCSSTFGGKVCHKQDSRWVVYIPFDILNSSALLPTDFRSPRFLMGNLLATGPSIPWCQVTAMRAVSQDSLFSFDRLTRLGAFKFIQLLIQFRESISINFYDLFSFFSSPGTFAVNIMVSWWQGSQRGYSFFSPSSFLLSWPFQSSYQGGDCFFCCLRPSRLP